MRPINLDTIPHLLRCSQQMLQEKIDSFMARFYAKWWGVELGLDCTFCGMPKFHRMPGSQITIGDGCRFLSTFSSNLHGLDRGCMFTTFSPESSLLIGAGSGFSGTVISVATRIEIGKRVFCGANTSITDSDAHSLDFRQRSPKHFGQSGQDFSEDVKSAPIRIGDDVFLGSRVIVLKGVTIGKGTVVGAGSVVSSSLPEKVIAAGQPARVIKNIQDIYPGI